MPYIYLKCDKKYNFYIYIYIYLYTTMSDNICFFCCKKKQRKSKSPKAYKRSIGCAIDRLLHQSAKNKNNKKISYISSSDLSII